VARQAGGCRLQLAEVAGCTAPGRLGCAAPVGPDAQRRPPPPLPSPDLYATDCGVGPKYSSWSPMMLSRGVLALQSPPQMAECRAQLV
jgi:hypothetical protein